MLETQLDLGDGNMYIAQGRFAMAAEIVLGFLELHVRQLQFMQGMVQVRIVVNLLVLDLAGNLAARIFQGDIEVLDRIIDRVQRFSRWPPKSCLASFSSVPRLAQLVQGMVHVRMGMLFLFAPRLQPRIHPGENQERQRSPCPENSGTHVMDSFENVGST